MNSASKPKLFDRLRGHLPDILYTNVPIPAFMEKPITFDFLKPTAQYAKNNTNKKKSLSANTIEGKIAAGKETKYSINNKDLEIDNGTWIIGNLEYGLSARAKGRMQGERFYVSQLIILKTSAN